MKISAKQLLALGIATPKGRIILGTILVLLIVGIIYAVVKLNKKKWVKEGQVNEHDRIKAELEESLKKLKKLGEQIKEEEDAKKIPNPEPTEDPEPIKSKSPTTGEKRNSAPIGNFSLVLNAESNIAEFKPTERKLLGEIYNTLFETDKWESELPKFTVPNTWRLQPLPASNNTLVKWKVHNKDFSRTVVVIFDAYQIHNDQSGPNWRIWDEAYPENAVEIPIDETKELVKAVNSRLNAKSENKKAA